MAKEIEYKFLINDLCDIDLLKVERYEEIIQGYLTRSGTGAAIRVRCSIWNDGREEAFVTIKSPAKGMTRDEYEYEIPVKDAFAMMQLCAGRQIVKTRYFIKHGEHTIELDFFGGKLSGLIMAEIEVESEDEKVEFPSWFGRNVTTDIEYTNIHLAEHGLPSGAY
jgi:adenylate cyclase